MSPLFQAPLSIGAIVMHLAVGIMIPSISVSLFRKCLIYAGLVCTLVFALTWIAGDGSILGLKLNAGLTIVLFAWPHCAVIDAYTRSKGGVQGP
jgi:hypothetical protein